MATAGAHDPMSSAADGSSYVDIAAFLDPGFSAAAYANQLVSSTNDASDTTVDLSTPLSKVLFDVQEVDTNIHTLSTRSAQPLLSHAHTRDAAARAIAADTQAAVAALRTRHAALDADIVRRHDAAEEVRLAASRLWIAAKIGRAVQRALVLGRQLDAHMGEAIRAPGAGPDDHRALVRATHSLLALRALLAATGPGGEGEHLARIDAMAALRTNLVAPAENRLRQRAQTSVREFVAAADPKGAAQSSFAQASEARARTLSACTALYLLSPPPPSKSPAAFAPSLLIQASESYLRAALTASAASLGRALAALSTLPRTLAEVSTRCRNVAALERLLASAEAPLREHPLLAHAEDPKGQSNAGSLLDPLLDHLDTSSLVSYFWRQLASELGPRVHELLNRGGVGARQLRAARERIRDAIRDAVVRGCEGARRADGKTAAAGAWEREVSVMVGSVVGPIGR